MGDWKPDWELIEFIEEKMKKSKSRDNYRIAVGLKTMTWDDMMKEVRKGTPFGRRMYDAFCESINENPKKRKQFKKFKKGIKKFLKFRKRGLEEAFKLVRKLKRQQTYRRKKKEDFIKFLQYLEKKEGKAIALNGKSAASMVKGKSERGKAIYVHLYNDKDIQGAYRKWKKKNQKGKK